MNSPTRGQDLRPLRFSFAALLAVQLAALIVLSIEVKHVFALAALSPRALAAIRLILAVALLAATCLLCRGREVGWKWGVVLQALLIFLSLLQAAGADLHQNTLALAAFAGIILQTASLRLFLLSGLVVRYGIKQIKPWFRERRVGTRALCKVQLVAQAEDGQRSLECQLINISLSGCLFCTNSFLGENEVIVLSPVHAPDLHLRVLVSSAQHRRIPEAAETVQFFKTHGAHSDQAIQFYAGRFEEKLSDEEFNRILRGRLQSDRPRS